MTGVPTFDLHPGGCRVACALGDHSIRLFDLGTDKDEGTPLPLRWKGLRYPYLCFNATGSKLVVAGDGTPEVQIWDTATLSLEKRLTLPEAVSEKPAWHSGSRVLAAAAGHRILLHDLESGQTKRLEGHEHGVTNLVFSVDGNLLASLSLDSTARLWDVRTGRQLLWTPATPGPGPQFSADGQRLAIRYGRSAKIFNIDCSAEFRGFYCRCDGFGNHFSFSPDSRLLCVAGERGVHFWDAATGEARGLVPVPRSRSLLYDPADKHLITISHSGAHLWPLASSRENGGVRLRIGPPEPLAEAEITNGGDVALSRDGRTFVVCSEKGRALILDVPTRKVMARLTGQEHLAFVSVSPDGRWVASSTWHGLEIVVWDAKTGKRVKAWQHFRGLIGKVTFAMEGKWLITTIGPDYQLTETENWQPRRIIPKESSFVGPVAFSDDGRILAIADTPHEVKLLDVDTGREYATLSLPASLQLGIMRFSPDGSRLAVLTEGGFLHLWDLQRIRQRLAAMKLDWEPPLPPQADADAPIHVEVDLGDLDPVRQSLARYRRALEANPNDANACNEVAWIYVTGPADLRKPEEALRLARNAVRLAPKEHNYLNTLGVAHYRLGQWQEAEAALQDAVKVDSGKAIAWDMFFLAMCYQRLGQPMKARECFDRADQWRQQARQTIANIPEQWMDELKLFHAEAAAVLGLPPN
jgi:WD40 repeat protein